MKNVINILIFLSFTIAINVFSKELTGTYSVSSEPYGNPDKKTHLYLHLTGDSAKETWESMDSKEILNPCGVNHMGKSSGNLVCGLYEHDKKYICSFLLNIKKGELDGHIPC